MVDENNRTASLAILGVVAAIGVVGLVLLFTNAQSTGQAVLPGADKVYGGALKDEQYPYLVDRKVGSYQDGEWGSEESAWQTGVPYRTYARSPPSIPTELSTCGVDERELDVTNARNQMYRYGFECRRMVNNAGQLIAFCCPLPELAKGTAREVTKQSFYS